MDGYPDHLSPGTDETKVSFEEWWASASSHYLNVPDNVAKHWVHEHWGYSPYGHLPSQPYGFVCEQWDSAKIWEIQSRWNNFKPDNEQCAEHGRHLASLVKPPFEYRTAIFMLEHRTFPSPIIVLDNRDGHMDRPDLYHRTDVLPTGYVLIEGHRRFNLALHLHRAHHICPTLPVWLMKLREPAT